MIYLFSLVLCLWLTWRYDVAGYTKGKWCWFYLLLAWFICVSGFQYMVGSDTPNYMEAYQNNYNRWKFDAEEMGGRYQPGWVLLNYCCKQITDDFVLLKLIQATFINVAVFSFFKRESKYIFLCVFLYAITTYLIFNFNVLRQSFAIGFLLYYISYLKRDKYVLASVFLIAAFMFHNSAILGLIILVFKFLRYNKVFFYALTGLSFLFALFLFRMDLGELLPMLIDSGYLGGGFEEHAQIYANSTKFEARDIRAGIGRYTQILLIVFTIWYYVRKKLDMFGFGIGLIFLFLQIANYSIPICFRFRQYFDMYFYVMFASVILDISSGRFKQIKPAAIGFCLLVYSLFPVHEYMYQYPGSPYRYFHQYYPYHSVFDKEDVDHRKINYFKWV